MKNYLGGAPLGGRRLVEASDVVADQADLPLEEAAKVLHCAAAEAATGSASGYLVGSDLLKDVGQVPVVNCVDCDFSYLPNARLISLAAAAEEAPTGIC
jgi:hypothetical protein